MRFRPGMTLLLVLACNAAHGASALVLPMPKRFGHIDAFTYDTAGHRNGKALLSLTRQADADVLLQVDMRLATGARTHLQALMRPIHRGRALRVVTERSASRNANGILIASMTIDHRAGFASCTDAAHRTHTIRLPHPDRVLNVPLNLFLRPLAAGAEKRADFQTLACGKDIRLVDTRAQVTARVPAGNGHPPLVRVRCRFQLGALLSALAGPFLPRLVFWFDAGGSGGWVAHHAPLYSNGPSILVLRRSLRPSELRKPLRRADGRTG
ncbi:MAG: hypothetical protein P8124_09790 [Gammaproteobacteria bacterium]